MPMFCRSISCSCDSTALSMCRGSRQWWGRTLHYHVIISMACSYSGDPLAEAFSHSWHCPGLWDRENTDSSLKLIQSHKQQARYHT